MYSFLPDWWLWLFWQQFIASMYVCVYVCISFLWRIVSQWSTVMVNNLDSIYCKDKNTQLLWYLSHKIWWRRMPWELYNQTHLGRLQLLAHHLPPQHTFLVFDIPPKQASRSALISLGSASPVLPLTPSAWPTYFLIFLCFLMRVILTHCFSHYCVSGCRPSMIASHSFSLSLCDSHKHIHMRSVYLNELGDTSSVSQQINHQKNWHICHKRDRLLTSRWILHVL